MAERPKFLLGYGERLTEPLEPILGGGAKKEAYSFDEARARLTPMLMQTVESLDALPAGACPNDEAVAVLTIHPEYIAKSYFPGGLLATTQLRAIGSRPSKVKPAQWGKKTEPEVSPSTDIFVAGRREEFRAWAQELPTWHEKHRGADELARVELLRPYTPAERIKSPDKMPSDPLLEVVLHTPGANQSDYVLNAFKAYLRKLGGRPDFEKRIYVGGLCFLPMRAPKANLSEVAKFSFLRALRPMPKLRPLSPLLRSVARYRPFAISLPTIEALDPSVRAAVFDGGFPPVSHFGPWVEAHDAPGVGAAVDEFVEHGFQVTSALLFGSLEDGVAPQRPFGKVDHYRVLDKDSGKDDDLFDVLHRIRGTLQTKAYHFVNLSIGPDIPIDDDDVHAWTATLDELLSSGETLATVAVGNGGDRDRRLGFHRIQVPSDSVNALSVGALNSPGKSPARADYSSVGPGRSPGLIKPDVVAFGGSDAEPFWVVDSDDPARSAVTIGTSFASPAVLRMGMGLRAHFGDLLSPLAIRALLIHCSQSIGPKEETGWGRVPDELEELVTCSNGTARIVYQGELGAAQYLRAQIPLPAAKMKGMVTIAATLCYATTTDPQDPGNYTRSGLDIAFRPHDKKFRIDKKTKRESIHPATKSFFQLHDYSTEEELRRDAHKWETVLHREQRFRGDTLRNPVFDIHYNARMFGRPGLPPNKLRYALVLTVRSPNTPDLYDQVVTRYRTQLEPLMPVIQISVKQ